MIELEYDRPAEGWSRFSHSTPEISCKRVHPFVELIQSRRDHFALATDADAEMFRSTEKVARHNGDFKLRAQKITQLICISVPQAREHDCPVLRPITVELASGIEKASQHCPVRLQSIR